MLQATLTTSLAPAPTTPPPEPTKTFTAFPVMTFLTPKTPTAPAPMPFTCTSTLCTTTDGATDFAFRLLQNLINMANAALARKAMESAAAIAVDGKLDTRTLTAYMPVSRGIGGTLAIFDFTPDPKYLATNALSFARTIAQWLGMTWVEATPTVPGHWQRMSVGQTVALPTYQAPAAAPAPTMPLPTVPTTPTPLCPPGSVATSRGCIPSAPPPPTQPQPQPQQAQPQLPPQGQQPVRVDVGPTTVRPSPDRGPPADHGPSADHGPPTTPPGLLRQLPEQAAQAAHAAREAARVRYTTSSCIARFNKSRKVFSIFCPIGSAAAEAAAAAAAAVTLPVSASSTAVAAVANTPAAYGLGIADAAFRCLYGNCGFGDDAADIPPIGFVKVSEETALPSGLKEIDKPFYKKPLFWVAVVGGTALVSGGSYMIYRRRKRA